jgi:triosephosphate isomerase
MKNLIIAANWKLHKTPNEVVAFFSELEGAFRSDSGAAHSALRHTQIFFPPAPLWQVTSEEVSRLKSTQLQGQVSRAGSLGEKFLGAFSWGAQNCFSELFGAFTGENSLACLKSMGGEWVLVGHSERRSIFGESDDLLAKKFWRAIEVGVSPMLCVGETREERESGRTEEVLTRQLSVVFKLGALPQGYQIAVAYEPIWAIGTGLVATPEMISHAHTLILKTLAQFGLRAVPILYGGSVKPENAAEILSVREVGGVLVGGASLAPASWVRLLSNSMGGKN